MGGRRVAGGMEGASMCAVLFYKVGGHSNSKGEKTVKYGKRIRFGATGKHLHQKSDNRQTKIKADRYIDVAMGFVSREKSMRW